MTKTLKDPLYITFFGDKTGDRLVTRGDRAGDKKPETPILYSCLQVTGQVTICRLKAEQVTGQVTDLKKNYEVIIQAFLLTDDSRLLLIKLQPLPYHYDN